MIFSLTKLSVWWRNNPTLGKICIALTTLHLLLLASLGYEKKAKPLSKKQKIIVRTIKASAAAPISTTNSGAKKENVISTNPTPTKKSPPPAKTAPKVPTKKIPSKKTPSPKESSTLKEKKLPPTKPLTPSAKNLQKSLKEIEETIAKIATNNDKMLDKRAKESSPTLAPLPQDLTFLIEEDYSSSLIEYLQNELRLPDSGEVKIELTLRKDGKIENIKVLSAKSEKNKQHLEEKIPGLQFPPFPKDEGGKKTKVFILTFCNDF